MSDSTSHKGSILVVDDEEEIRLVLYTLLSDAGYHVRVAGDGEEALDMLRNELAEVIIADYRMPQMDGLEFLEATWSFSPKPRTIMLTGNATVEMAMEAARHGVVTIVHKPFVADELINLIEFTLKDFRETRKSVSDSAALRRESEELLEESRKIFSSIKKHMDRLEREPVSTGSGQKTFSFGPPGVSKLAHCVSIIDMKVLEEDTGKGGLFVDDGGNAVLLSLVNTLCPDGKTIKLQSVSEGITFGKLFPISLLYPNFIHFRDSDGNILKDISCIFDYARSTMEALHEPFEVFKLDCTATADEVKDAYRQLIARLDNAKGAMTDSVYKARMAMVNESYKRIRQYFKNLEANFEG